MSDNWQLVLEQQSDLSIKSGSTAAVAEATGLRPEVLVDLHEQGGCQAGASPEVYQGRPGMTRDEIVAEFGDWLLPDSIDEAAEALGISAPEHQPSPAEWGALRSHATGVVELTGRLDAAEVATRELARGYVPSLSMVVGPLGAAKLVVLAGGRERLARMPSGSLQVLGASGAMAAHRRGAPPPKHSPVLFSLPQVSRSPRWVRGKISRFLAGKCSIAVRVDHFDGEPWDEEQIAEINREVDAIKARFPKPPKRG